MINFNNYYVEIEEILATIDREMASAFRNKILTSEPKEIYLWCSANLKLIQNERLHEILRDFYFSVR